MGAVDKMRTTEKIDLLWIPGTEEYTMIAIFTVSTTIILIIILIGVLREI